MQIECGMSAHIAKPDLCGILFIPHGHGPKDELGCSRPDRHTGSHEFRDTVGRLWGWEYDSDCHCPHCCSESSDDHCLLYWQVEEPVKQHAESSST